MSKYNPAQIEKMLSSITILIDTREQDTKMLRMRCEGFNAPCRRATLNAGDYAAEYINVDSGATEAFTGACIERKMNLDELATCFTIGRPRFQREFERAKADSCRIHLIIEGDNYERLFAGKYRSKLLPQSLIASIMSWQARYQMQLHFCKPETTGRLIKEILWYELREWLINQ